MASRFSGVDALQFREALKEASPVRRGEESKGRRIVKMAASMESSTAV